MDNLSSGTMLDVVSNQWVSRPDDEKFLSLSDMYDARFNAEMSTAIKQKIYNMSEFSVDYNAGNLSLKRGSLRLLPTAWSMQQLCTRVRAPYPALKLWQDDGNSVLVSDTLNHSFKTRGENMQLYHEINNDSGFHTLHAATSDKYTRIFDYEVIKLIQHFVFKSRGQWKVPGTIDWSSGQHIADNYLGNDQVTKEATTLYAGDRDMFIFLVDDKNPIDLGITRNGQRDVVFPGFIVGNSTVGYKPIWMMTFYFRGVCMNRCIWGAEGIKEYSNKHLTNVRQYALEGDYRSSDPMKRLSFVDRLMELEKRQQLGRDLTAKSIQGAMQVEEFKTDEARTTALRKVEIPATTAKKIVANFETVENYPILTRWDMHNAITAEARTIMHQNARTNLEKTATRFLRRAA